MYFCTTIELRQRSAGVKVLAGCELLQREPNSGIRFFPSKSQVYADFYLSATITNDSNQVGYRETLLKLLHKYERERQKGCNSWVRRP